VKLTKRLFYFLIIFTPLAFGTVEFWSLAVMEILSMTALFAFMISSMKNKEEIHAVPGIIPLLLFLLFILIQIIPLPAQVIKFLSPSAFDIHRNAAGIIGSSPWMTISIHPHATVLEFLRYSSYVAFYILTVQLLRDKDVLKKTIIVIIIFGGLLSFSSILQFYLTKDMALWFRHVPHNSMIVGPYICHNHYAALMAMIFPVALGIFFFHRPRFYHTSLFRGIVEILSQEKANIHILIGAAVILMVSSIFVSVSRGGMISTCLSLIFFSYLLVKRKISRGNTLLLIFVIIITTLSVTWFGWDQILDRFARLKNAQGIIYESRLDFWKDSRHIIKAFPATGSGFGTFVDIYPSHQTISGDLTLVHAHNDYIELAVEGGLISLLFAAAFIFTLFQKTYRVFKTRRDAYSVYVYMGSITGIIAILIHSVVDFNFHIGANGLWFFFIAGLAVSAANTGIRQTSKRTRLLPVQSLSVKRLSMASVTVMMAGTVVISCSFLSGKFYFSHIKNFQTGADTPVEDLKKINQISGYAVKFDPLNAIYYFAKANSELFLDQADLAVKNFKKAIQLNPAKSTYLKRLGLYFGKTGEDSLAEQLLESSVKFDISNADNALQYGIALLYQQKTEQGIDYIKTAVQLDPELIDTALTAMAMNRIDFQEMEKAVPEIPGPYITWALFLYNSGARKLAKLKFLTAIDYIEKQEKINRWEFYRIYKFFVKRGQLDEAIKVMQRAAENLPQYADIRITLGDLYRKTGIAYRAQQEYEHALIIDPGNKHAQKRLDKLNQ